MFILFQQLKSEQPSVQAQQPRNPQNLSDPQCKPNNPGTLKIQVILDVSLATPAYSKFKRSLVQAKQPWHNQKFERPLVISPTTLVI